MGTYCGKCSFDPMHDGENPGSMPESGNVNQGPSLTDYTALVSTEDHLAGAGHQAWSSVMLNSGIHSIITTTWAVLLVTRKGRRTK